MTRPPKHRAVEPEPRRGNALPAPEQARLREERAREEREAAADRARPKRAKAAAAGAKGAA